MISYTPIQRILISLFFISISSLLVSIETINPSIIFYTLTFIFLCLVALEYLSSERFFSLPPAFFSAFMFLNIFLSGVIGFLTDLNLDDYTFGSVSINYLLLSAHYTIIANQVLWISFNLIPDRRFTFFQSLNLKGVPISAVHVCIVISIIALFVGISTNSFGYIQDEVNIFSTFVRFGVSIGLIGLTLVCIYFRETNKRYLYFILFLNILIGVISGSKTQVITPVLIYVFTLYLLGAKLSIRPFILLAFCLILAYSVIEPFRAYYDFFRPQLEGAPLYEVIPILIFSDSDLAVLGSRNFFLEFLERINYLYVLSRTLEYADLNNFYLAEEWKHFFMSPYYGVIPRFIWESKPLADFGSWVAVEIFHLNSTTAVGVTPQGYAYLVGRWPAIVVCFLIYGLIQRIGYNLFFDKDLLPIFIYFYFFVLFPSFPLWTSVSSFIQNLILITLFLGFTRLVFNKTRDP